MEFDKIKLILDSSSNQNLSSKTESGADLNIVWLDAEMLAYLHSLETFQKNTKCEKEDNMAKSKGSRCARGLCNATLKRHKLQLRSALRGTLQLALPWLISQNVYAKCKSCLFYYRLRKRQAFRPKYVTLSRGTLDISLARGWYELKISISSTSKE